MIALVTTFLVLIGASYVVASILSDRYGGRYLRVFKNLIWYHTLLALVYYIYAINNPSDSWEYHRRILVDYRGDTWFDFYGISTQFIEFLGYPFVKYFQLPFESVMMIFAWFGLLGFFYFYIAFKESVHFKHTLFGFDLLLIIFFLPNLHFWSASFGKGSVIFLGMGLFFYGLCKVNSRFLALFMGALIVYHVRPHILFIMLIGTLMGFTFSSKGVNWTIRVAVVIVSAFVFDYIYSDVLSLIGFEEEELINESTDLTRRIKGLSKAASGVDITSYSFPMKMFTFLFRPLFFDAPGTLGIVVSFENLFYIVMFIKLIRLDFFSFLVKSDAVVKSGLVSFIGISSALAQISANLGLAMRQKSQIMMLILFVIMKFLDEQKRIRWQQLAVLVKMRARNREKMNIKQ